MNEPTPKLDHREIEHDTACSSLRLKRHLVFVVGNKKVFYFIVIFSFLFLRWKKAKYSISVHT